MKKIIIRPTGIEELDLTAEEISQKETDTANALVQKEKQKQAQTNEANNKTSAQNKLKALGLTDAEIEAL